MFRSVVFTLGVLFAFPWSGVAQSTKGADKLYEDGLRFEESGDSDSAVGAYESAIAEGSTDIRPALNLALIYKRTREFSKAEAVLKKAIVSCSERHGPSLDSAKLYNNLGEVHRASGQHAEALSALQKALSLDGTIPGPNLNMGLVYDVGLGKPSDAEPFYLKEIDLAPSAPATFDAYLNLAIYYQESTKDYEKSLTMAQAALKVNPTTPDAYKAFNCLANTYYLKGNKAEAIRNWEKVVELAPDSVSGRNARSNLQQLR